MVGSVWSPGAPLVPVASTLIVPCAARPGHQHMLTLHNLERLRLLTKRGDSSVQVRHRHLICVLGVGATHLPVQYRC